MDGLYCNPMPIAYKYQHPLFGKYAYKEAADPTIILFNGKYFLFTSKCGGFYYSDDLLNWDFFEDRSLEIHGYAPDVNEHDGWLYFCASSYAKKCKILRTRDPFSGFEVVSIPFTFWDPHLYFEDDRCYLYWGCSSKEPIWGVEMDIKTMQPIGEKVAIVPGDKENHGIDNKDIYKQDVSLWQKYINLFVGDGTFIEGAFINKINGKYYFQYATPGTEFPTYGDAVLVGDSPLGPFKWQEHNPFSLVPSGFFTGAGHGSTFFDKFGNLWHASSVCVGVNHNFERRLGLWPCGVDDDGIMFCNQYFSDYPKKYPNEKFDPQSVTQDLMLLSYKKSAVASSFLEENPVKNAFDENVKTCWTSRSNRDEWLLIDLGDEFDVSAVSVNFADFKTKKKKAPLKEYGGTFTQERYIEKELVRYNYVIFSSLDGKSFEPFGECQDTTLPHNLVCDEKRARFVKVVFKSAPFDQNFSISGLRVFGKGCGKKPEKAFNVSSKRTGKTTAIMQWEAKNATGVCIRFGEKPDKLYNSILLYDVDNYKATFLNSETETYYFAVDTFNENGITPGDVCEMI